MTDEIDSVEAVVRVTKDDESEAVVSGADGDAADGVEVDGNGAGGGKSHDVRAAGTDNALFNETAAGYASFTEVFKGAVIGVEGTTRIRSGIYLHESCDAAVKANDEIDDGAF